MPEVCVAKVRCYPAGRNAYSAEPSPEREMSHTANAMDLPLEAAFSELIAEDSAEEVVRSLSLSSRASFCSARAAARVARAASRSSRSAASAAACTACSASRSSRSASRSSRLAASAAACAVPSPDGRRRKARAVTGVQRRGHRGRWRLDRLVEYSGLAPATWRTCSSMAKEPREAVDFHSGVHGVLAAAALVKAEEEEEEDRQAASSRHTKAWCVTSV